MKDSKYIVALVLCLGITTTVLGQGKANHLYFAQTGVSFETGEPVYLEESAMYCFEGCAAVSDTTGQLLFYTNGGALTDYPDYPGGVYNRNNELMPNGAFIDDVGCFSSHHGTIIIPSLTSTRQFYIITTSCVEQSFQGAFPILKYSLVDMSLDGGLGDVVETGVNLDASTDGLDEIVASAHVPCSDKTWIYYANLGKLKKIEYSPSGFGTSEVVINTLTQQWQVRSDPNGAFLWVSGALYSIDPSNGNLLDPISIDGIRGCFSPSGQFLYIARNAELFQYDLWSDDILDSEYSLGSSTEAHMVNGGDGRIYFIEFFGLSELNSRISNPNLAGDACNFEPDWELINDQGPVFGNPEVNPYFIYEGDPCITTGTSDLDLSEIPFVLQTKSDGSGYRLHASQPLNLEILTATGQLVDRQSIEPGSFEFGSGLSQQVYLLRISCDDGVWVERIQR